MLPRIFVDQVRILEKSAYVADREKVHRIRKVLRLQEGDELVLLDNTGKEYLCEIEQPAQNRVKAAIKEIREKEVTKPLLYLYPALIKKNRFETILEKGTELGVNVFTPILTQRTELTLPEIPSRWKRVVREAAEQSERVRLPKFGQIAKLKKVLEQIPAKEKVILFSPQGSKSIRDYKLSKDKKKVHLLIGPEGGFVQEELQEARSEVDAEVLTLSDRPLRTETASLVGCAFLKLMA